MGILITSVFTLLTPLAAKTSIYLLYAVRCSVQFTVIWCVNNHLCGLLFIYLTAKTSIYLLYAVSALNA